MQSSNVFSGVQVEWVKSRSKTANCLKQPGLNVRKYIQVHLSQSISFETPFPLHFHHHFIGCLLFASFHHSLLPLLPPSFLSSLTVFSLSFPYPYLLPFVNFSLQFPLFPLSFLPTLHLSSPLHMHPLPITSLTMYTRWQNLIQSPQTGKVLTSKLLNHEWHHFTNKLLKRSFLLMGGLCVRNIRVVIKKYVLLYNLSIYHIV